MCLGVARFAGCTVTPIVAAAVVVVMVGWLLVVAGGSGSGSGSGGGFVGLDQQEFVKYELLQKTMPPLKKEKKKIRRARKSRGYTPPRNVKRSPC
ncbi:hypothetical protein K402DRAFT_135632 [Aulographum hederae CBS 113979]|uniref:Uncharacterized protein n=1 Tax=Aulographum hederae CBS 113979 TaxID=1176131 RepID=A0A6G1GV10_9PEZI|nr:hypothetical protein K402DRAFT_135632 [Aulographum hederae CBS 113979]